MIAEKVYLKPEEATAKYRLIAAVTFRKCLRQGETKRLQRRRNKM